MFDVSFHFLPPDGQQWPVVTTGHATVYQGGQQVGVVCIPRQCLSYQVGPAPGPRHVRGLLALRLGGGAEMSFCIDPLEMVIWVVLDR